jgi:hypothetical protein
LFLPADIENSPASSYILPKGSDGARPLQTGRLGKARMIRFVLLFLLLALCAYVVMQIVRAAKGGRIDWTGISFTAGFIVLAFWLRHVTGLG